eukprot:1856697-Rhodomonas_salina.1
MGVWAAERGFGGRIREVHGEIMKKLEAMQESTKGVIESHEKEMLQVFRSRLFEVEDKVKKSRSVPCMGSPQPVCCCALGFRYSFSFFPPFQSSAVLAERTRCSGPDALMGVGVQREKERRRCGWGPKGLDRKGKPAGSRIRSGLLPARSLLGPC